MVDASTNDGDDEERYSRQFYTLGARAHSLVRSSTIIFDGPPRSGLVYECAKNVALSGVGRIIILDSDGGDDATETMQDGVQWNSQERLYHDDTFDDLGIVYRNCARAESSSEEHSSMEKRDRQLEDEEDSLQLLVGFIRRLNPSVKVQMMKRTAFVDLISTNAKEKQNQSLGSNPVLICVDRPQSIQIALNNACRTYSNQKDETKHQHGTTHRSIPFVSLETAGVFGRIFCDFGENFQVVDEDGESPKTILLDRVEVGNNKVIKR